MSQSDQPASWSHGYFTASPYEYGYFRETAPVWLHLACLARGHLTPLKGFRYMDLGCGQGYNVVMHAVSHPDAEFIGVDFMPGHIAHARSLADSLGLRNVRFLEADLVEMLQTGAIPADIDYVVAHGVSSWVAEPVRSALYGVVGRALRPGGVFYNSYNTLPGWIDRLGFQHLVLQLQRRQGGAEALRRAIGGLLHMLQGSPAMRQAMPNLVERMQRISEKELPYLLQEYCNAAWNPQYFSDVAHELAAHKMQFLGNAELAEPWGAPSRPELAAWLAEEPDQVMREQLQDIALVRQFRRDLMVRGIVLEDPHWLDQRWAEQQVVLHPLRAPEGREGMLPLPMAEGMVHGVEGPAMWAVLDALHRQSGPTTMGALAAALPQLSAPHQVRGLVLAGIQAAWIRPVFAELMSASSRDLSLGLADLVCTRRRPYQFVPVPATGLGLDMSDADWACLNLEAAGPLSAARWTEIAQRAGERLMAPGREPGRTEAAPLASAPSAGGGWPVLRDWSTGVATGSGDLPDPSVADNPVHDYRARVRPFLAQYGAL